MVVVRGVIHLGVSAMLQIGQAPGSSRITCGCMPQVQSCFFLLAWFTAALPEPPNMLWIDSCHTTPAIRPSATPASMVIQMTSAEPRGESLCARTWVFPESPQRGEGL
jgi:hypothetical protein